MKKNTKYLICIMVVFGITSTVMIPPVQVAIASTLDSETLRERLLEFIDAWQLTNDPDQGEYMDEVLEYAADVKKHLPAGMARFLSRCDL